MFRTRLIGVSLTLLSALVSVAAAKAVDVPTWTATGSIKTARYSAASALLGNGDALLIGGRLPYQPAPIISVERFNHTTGQWAYTGTTLSARNSAQAVTLRDGHVLLAGGESSPLNYYDTTELYDPGTGKWSPGPARTDAPNKPVDIARLN